MMVNPMSLSSDSSSSYSLTFYTTVPLSFLVSGVTISLSTSDFNYGSSSPSLSLSIYSSGNSYINLFNPSVPVVRL